MDTRDDLKRRLREKIKGARGGSDRSNKGSSKQNIESLILNSNDATTLQVAQQIIKGNSVKKVLENMTSDSGETSNTNHSDICEEEEAPPL